MRDVIAVSNALPDLAQAWQVDTGQVSFCGDSAGSHVVLTAAMALRGKATAPGALTLLNPAVDPDCSSDSHRRLADGPVLSSAGMRWFWNACLGERAASAPPEVTPLSSDLSGLPPTLIVTAGEDVLQDEGAALARRMKEQGVSVRHRLMEGAVHGFLSIAPDCDSSRICLKLVADFLAAGPA